MRLQVFLVWLTLTTQTTLWGQTISTQKDTALLSKDFSFGTLHDKLLVTNETSDSLSLNWKLTFSGKVPNAWSINFSDPENSYPTVTEGQDEDFVLKSDSTGKLIVGVTHNGQTGFGYLQFRVVNNQVLSDSILFVFSVEVTQGSIGIVEHVSPVKILVEPNATVFYAANAQISLYQLDGRLLRESMNKMEITSRESGIVIIQIDGRVIYRKLLSKN